MVLTVRVGPGKWGRQGLTVRVGLGKYYVKRIAAVTISSLAGSSRISPSPERLDCEPFQKG
jgi:hypothetical protein